MKPKNIITIIGAVNIIQGIAFFFGAEMLTTQSFPEDLLQGGGLAVGIEMHWPLAVAFVVLGIIILSTRSLDTNAAKKVLNYIGVAYLFFLINGLLQHFTTATNVPMPALGLIAFISILSFITANRKTS
jgi:hypothetical protein|tara:strand:+ start:303 stop:689 length:387 start_codon:yes stop_codon:yes gene_type:complete